MAKESGSPEPAAAAAEPISAAAHAGSIGRHGAIYGAGMLLNRFAGFLLIPILLHTMTAQEWGAYTLILAISQFLIVVPCAMVDAMIRLHFDQKDQAGENAVLATTFAGFLALSVLILALAYPMARLSAHLVFDGRSYVPELFVANIGLVFELLLDIELTHLRIRKRSGLFVLTSLARSLIQFAAAILFVIGFGMGVMGVVLGGTLAVAVVSAPIGLAMARRSGIRPRRPIAREMACLSGPLAPAWIAKSSLDLLEPYLVNHLANLATVGLLAVATKLADQLRLLVTGPFAQIWSVSLFEAASDEQQSIAVHRVLAYFFLLLSAAALGLALFAPEIVRVIAAQSFWSAAVVVPILALNQIVKLINFHFETALIERKRMLSLPIINGLSVVLAIGLYWYLVPRFGIMGAAAAAIAIQGARLLATLAAVARCSTYIARFPWRTLAILLPLGAACYGLGAGLPEQGIGSFAAKVALLLAFILLGFLGPAFRSGERQGILHGLASRAARLRAGTLRTGGSAK